MCYLALIVLALGVALLYYLPWYLGLGLLVIGALSAKRVGGWLLLRLLATPFRLKGAVLRGAQAQVHSVTPAEPTGDPGRARYWIDVTITPSGQSKTPFGLWEPADLVLARPGARPTMGDPGEPVGQVAQVLVHDGREFQEDALDDGGKFSGALRLRLLADLEDDAEAACFQYYFETFGEVRLPGLIDSAD